MRTIRFAREKDACALLQIYAPYVRDTAVTFEYEVPTEEEFRERIHSVLMEYPYLVCESDGEIAGYAYAHRQMERAAYQWNAELSVYISDHFQHSGIGKAFYGALLEILRLQNVQNAYGGVTAPNPGSERLHEELGFRQLGIYHRTGYKCGSWHDVVWFEKEIGEHEKPSLPFLPIGKLDRKELTRILSGCFLNRAEEQKDKKEKEEKAE